MLANQPVSMLQRILLTGMNSMVIKATRTIPHATIQEVAARTTVPWLRVPRTDLKSQDESKGQMLMGYGRNSDRPSEDSAAKIRAGHLEGTPQKISGTGWDCSSAGSRSY